MADHVVALNAGSSSLKFALYELVEANRPSMRWRGQVERLGDAPRLLAESAGGRSIDQPLTNTNSHDEAIHAFLEMARENLPDIHVRAIGHRVVHGGTVFSEPVKIDDSVIDTLQGFIPFAPLHQPYSLAGIRAASAAFPGTAQVACFDTAFHRKHPWVNDTFALPQSYYDKGVRRYGFHGLSYDYVSQKLKEIAPGLYDGRVVIAHLGNGASMCAVSGGRAVASTMGFSALDGLPMGTRSGQLDPGVVLYMMQQDGMTAEEIAEVLYRKSGLLGLSGISSDMRTLLAAATPRGAQGHRLLRVPYPARTWRALRCAGRDRCIGLYRWCPGKTRPGSVRWCVTVCVGSELRWTTTAMPTEARFCRQISAVSVFWRSPQTKKW